MTASHYTVELKKTVLASLIGLCLSQPCFALEALSDENLSDTTGEGVALLPQDAYMVFRGYGANESKAELFSNRSKDTGYIHYLPTGPLSDTALNRPDGHSVGKADLYLYGLALSKSDGDSNSRLATTEAAAKISSWGTADNPWLLQVGTESNVPTFTPDNGAVKNTETGSVPYFALEAPLYGSSTVTSTRPNPIAIIGTDGKPKKDVYGNVLYQNQKIDPNGPDTSSNWYQVADKVDFLKDIEGADAYNLKLATWADALVLDQSKAESDPNLYLLGQMAGTSDVNRANRLRLQAIWNGFSINGSRIQLFQTLGGATNTGGMSVFSNNTLGASGVLRFNSGDSSNLRAKITTQTTRNQSAWTMIHDGSTVDFDKVTGKSSGASCNNAGGGTPNYSGGCQYQVRKSTTTDTSNTTWSAASPEITNKVLRLSTRETSDTNNIYTPAINGGGAPNFDSSEGIYIYNLNSNLVLGTTYQPLTLGSDGKNFSLEVARIPNKETIYKKIYTDYTGLDKTYLGSTCNVYQCGSSSIAGFQGNSATHSSITIGSTVYDNKLNQITAYNGVEAIGISFGKLVDTSTGDVITGVYTDIQSRFRQAKVIGTWTYSCNLVWSCSTGTVRAWEYKVGAGNPGSYITPPGAANVPSSCTYNCTGTKPSTAQDPANSNRDWNASGALWETASAGALGLVGMTPNISNMPGVKPDVAPNIPSNNFGSAAIDGLLIQHMKITTKGL